jgi:hypothetical protein
MGNEKDIAQETPILSGVSPFLRSEKNCDFANAKMVHFPL